MNDIETILNLNYVLALFGIVTILVTTILIIDFKTSRSFERIVQGWGLTVAFITTLFGTAVSLVYSEVFGLIPCGLCWFERMALYPQVLLIATGLYFKDKLMPRYGIILSAFGLIISLYHHYIQMGGNEFIRCPISGVGSDCVKRFFFEFGFVTFPLMGAISFAFLIVLYLYLLKTRSD